MSASVLLCRLVLAGVLAVAGVGKLRDRRGAGEGAISLGVPASLAPAVVILSAGLELAAALLLLTPLAELGAIIAAALLFVFTVAMLVTLGRGEHPACHCFGDLHSAPIGWKTVTRNVVLIAVAAFVLFGFERWPASRVSDWLENASGMEVALGVGFLLLLIAVVVEGFAIVGILRQNGRLILRLDALESAGPTPSQGHRHAGLPIGAEPPRFSLPDLDGVERTLDDMRRPGIRTLLVFTDPGCGPCTALMPDIATWQQDLDLELTVVLISRGSVERNREEADRLGLDRILIQEDDEVATSFRYEGTPGAVLIAANGLIASHLVSGADLVRGLVRTTCSPDNGAPTTREVGSVAPEVRLSSLAGESFSLRDLKGREVVLLFWDPGCGFCDRMYADLRDWDSTRHDSAPHLVVVTRGSVEANERLRDLSSTVVIDPSGSGVMRHFGAAGTPTAVKIDTEGRFASLAQPGAPAVLRLLST